MFARITTDGWLDSGPMRERLPIVEHNGSAVVVKSAGRRINQSGVRGMPDHAYQPAEYIVYRILGTEEKGEEVWAELEELIRWSVRRTKGRVEG